MIQQISIAVSLCVQAWCKGQQLLRRSVASLSTRSLHPNLPAQSLLLGFISHGKLFQL